MTDVNVKQTPDELLVQKILNDIREKKLLTASQLDDLPERLTSGRMKKEEWQGMVEIVVDAEKRGKNANKD